MIQPRQPEYLFEHVKDSVMLRTMEGIINFWNHSAEKLYGWKKEEAIGRVSHDLLQTQFPKPLEEIESELVRSGRWEGRLVHTTRDGGRVVVESRWTLGLNGQPGALVEINTVSAGRESDSSARTGSYSAKTEKPEPMRANKNSFYERLSKITNVVLAAGVFLSVAAFLIYGLFGHELIKAMHDGKFLGIGLWFMESKATTPLGAYYEQADKILITLTSWSLTLLIAILLLTFLVREPVGAFLTFCSLFLCSLMLFGLLELFPSLIVPLRLDRIHYYGWKACCVPDDSLAFRYRSSLKWTLPFKGYLYSPVYGIQVPPVAVELTTDKDGFINNNAAPEFPDAVVIGDSFVADALNEADTFGRRLERVSGLTVANLGVAGYGPFQYLEVLKKYGIPLKPKYAFFVFYAGNDIEDTTAFLEWKRGGAYHYAHLLSKPLLTRYIAALNGVSLFVRGAGDTILPMSLRALNGYSNQQPTGVHPDIAVLSLGNDMYKMLISPENKVASTAGLISSEEWQAVKSILAEFKKLCLTNHIDPIAMYIPTITSIYAEHSTGESGRNWLQSRDQQIARKRNTENAMIALAKELDIRLVDLSPPFESAAQDGKLLYHPFDTHWNSEGRQVAAAYVAKILKSLSKEPGPRQAAIQ